ncbi:MAG: hypothetical protein HQK63_07065 [Desulfamplus sp.]|nr:hypothetical protein [Desulfamplus sp.]
MPTIVFQINKLAIPISPTPVPLPNGEGDNSYSLPLGRVGEGQNNYLESCNTINISATIAGIMNIVIALFIFYRLYPLHTISMPLIHTTKPIWSTKTMLYHQEDYRIRVEGLRKLCRSDFVYTNNIADTNRDSIWNYPEFIAIMIKQNNPTYKINGNIVEKYWLANAFGAAKKLDALPYLEKLINDPSINVQCAAIEAMTTISINNSNLDISHFFEDKIFNSNEPYVQKRAYNALKRLEKI